MYVNESKWIRDELAGLDLPLGASVLDIGSQTLDYRTREQPYVDANVIAPLRERGFEVTHADAKRAEGVDVVLDVTATDPDPRTVLGRTFDLVICAGLLANVEDYRTAIRNVAALVGEQGWLVVTVTERYRLEPDPIDNRWRPTPDQVAAAFHEANPELELVRTESLRIDESRYYRDWISRPSRMPVLGRWWVPWPGFTDRLRMWVPALRWRQGCLLMCRPQASPAAAPSRHLRSVQTPIRSSAAFTLGSPDQRGRAP